MSLLIKSARFVLFGGNGMGNKPTVGKVVKTKAINLGRRLVGLTPVGGFTWQDLARHYAQDWFLGWFGLRSKDRLPADFPVRIFETIDQVLRARGGFSNKEQELPNFWANKTGCTSNPVMWTMRVEYAPAADPQKVFGMEMTLEDQLSRAGYDVNVRILNRPLRIEIDRPTVPTARLADYWEHIGRLKVDQRLCAPALSWGGENTYLLNLELSDEDFSVGIFGSPGSGKTQLAMSLLLSLCYANSPATLSLLLCDPKVVDFKPFGDHGLPQLAAPVATDPEECARLILAAEAEMDHRTRQAKGGDTSFLSRAICIYVDELADLMNSLPNRREQEVSAALQRIAQKGRGVGFILIEATQRVFEVDARLYSKLNCRIVGRTRNANDSAAAVGLQGVQTHKLPGKGAFELYCSNMTGQRIQALFVADPKQRDYERQIGHFIQDIRKRWAGVDAHWQPMLTSLGQTVDLAPTPDRSVEPDQKDDEAGIDPELFAELRAEYEQDPALFSVRTVRRLHQVVHRVEARHAKAKRIFDQFLSIMQGGATDFASD